VLDVQVRFDDKQATVRYVPGKTTLDRILKRYDDTPFHVTQSGDIVTILQTPHATVRGWTVRESADPAPDNAPDNAPDSAPEKSAESTDGNANPPPPAIRLMLAIEPKESAVTGDADLALNEPPASELRLVEPFQTAAEFYDPTDDKSKAPAAQRHVARLREAIASMPMELVIPVSVRFAVTDQQGARHAVDATLNVVLRSVPAQPEAGSSATGVALIDGALELRLGHLCSDRGCLEHFHQSLNQIPGLGAVQASPSLEAPRAVVFLRAGEPVDLWSLREKLRAASMEVRDIVPRELTGFTLRVDLPRVVFSPQADAEQCLACRERTQQLLQQLTWASEAQLAGGGFHFSCRSPDVDLSELLDALQHAGVAPSAVWLIPQGAPMPKSAAPVEPATEPQASGQPQEQHQQAGDCCNYQPLVEIDFPHAGFDGRLVSHMLAGQRWIGHSLVSMGEPAIVQARIADRQYCSVTSLLREIQAGGESASGIRLRQFGDIRIQLKFAHVCGEVEYSKPPQRKKKAAAEANDGEQADGQIAEETDEQIKEEPPKEEPPKDEKPFVPRPLRPDISSNGRKAIEAALQNVAWIREGVFQGYHTRPEFTSVNDLTLSLAVNGDDVVRLDELLTALRDAGFPPASMIVSRRFSGIPFAAALPGQVKLASAQGDVRSTASLRQADRPLVVAFVSLKCKRDKYKDYQPDPKLYERFGQTIGKYKDRVDFVAVSANPDDTFDEATQFWASTGLPIELLRDSEGALRSALNAQETPAPHLYVFDAGGLLRYAGDAHNEWDKPAEASDDYLADALDLVLAKDYQANGAVHYKSAVCNCSDPKCKCPKCGCGPSCRCAIGH
jgi:hypothetical protein